MPSIRLLIASEHPIVRTALGTLLKGIRDFEVVAEVNLSHLVKTAREHSPEVFLVELTGAGLVGLRADGITPGLPKLISVFPMNSGPG